MEETNEKILETVKAELKHHCFVLDDMKTPQDINGGVTLTAKSRSFEIEIPQSILGPEGNVLIETISNSIVKSFKDVSKISFYKIEHQTSMRTYRKVIVHGEWLYE